MGNRLDHIGKQILRDFLQIDDALLCTIIIITISMLKGHSIQPKPMDILQTPASLLDMPHLSSYASNSMISPLSYFAVRVDMPGGRRRRGRPAQCRNVSVMARFVDFHWKSQWASDF